jgi:DNA polymerase-3 subunit alpha
MRQADFVHLHLHSAYSLLQSTIRLPQLVKKAREYRLPALAITDHGNLFGCIEFYDLAYSNGIKPIIGCELTVGPAEETESEKESSAEPATHIVLLARNRKGYQNLLQLITKAHSQGWQQEPRISSDQLYQHHQGLIILSGCHRGEIATRLLKEDRQGAEAKAAEYMEVFGREFFFVELQPARTDLHRILNERLVSLARQLNLHVVATANSHTIDPGEAELVRILTAIRLRTTVKEIPPPLEHGFLSPEEMKAEFAHLPEAITTTMTIAERCNVDLNLGKIHLPKYFLEKGQDAMALLRQQAVEGLDAQLPSSRPGGGDYRKRLDAELKTIEQLGLADYFLVVADFVRFAREKGVPVGPGSGSAGSSLTAYALGITRIDPLQHDLLFERLINPLSPEFPDMDLGFGMEMREKVHQYLRSKYGQDRVAQIVSLVTMQPRTATRDLKKVLALSREDVNGAPGDTEQAPEGEVERKTSGLQLEEELSAAPQSKVLELAAALEGLPRQVSTHATGMVIGDGPLVQRVPLYRGPKDEWVSQYNVRALKRAGLVKFDFIARKALTVIRKVLDLIGDESDLSVALEALPLNDEAAFELLRSGQVGGIPHLEGARARDLLLKWQPRQWQDLIALLALVRPVALESGLTENFLRTQQDGQQEESFPRSADKRVGDGTAFLLFDVDLTRRIARTTGWSLEKADELCRIMMKGEEEAEDIRLEFIESAEGKGYDRDEAETTWSTLERSAGVVAERSKTVAQGLTVLQAAFLKARFPEHYMAALLSSELRQHDLLAAHVEDCGRENLRLLPPDINGSGVEFNVETGGIRVGLAAVRHVSQATATAIVKARRERGPFHSLFELLTSVDLEHLGKRALDGLIKAGAMDSFRCGRQQLHEMLPEVVEQARRGQMALFDHCDMESQSVPGSSPAVEWDEATKVSREKEALGFYLSGHPLSEFRAMVEELAPGGTARLGDLPGDSQSRLGGVVEEIRMVSSRKGEPLRFLRLEDFNGSVEVVVFEDVHAEYQKYIYQGALLLVSGRVAKESGQVRLVADEIMLLEEAAADMASSVHLQLTVEGLSGEPLKELKQLLKTHPGSCPVYLHFGVGQQTVVVQKLPTSFRIRPNKELQGRLIKQFGKDCLEVRYQEPHVA